MIYLLKKSFHESFLAVISINDQQATPSNSMFDFFKEQETDTINNTGVQWLKHS